MASRKEEKALSRAEDARKLASGEISREGLNEKNSAFRFPVRLNHEKTVADSEKKPLSRLYPGDLVTHVIDPITEDMKPVELASYVPGDLVTLRWDLLRRDATLSSKEMEIEELKNWAGLCLAIYEHSKHSWATSVFWFRISGKPACEIRTYYLLETITKVIL